MTDPAPLKLQLAVFVLVSAAFANIYITQPVLPILQHEFSADIILASLTVSAVILGIAFANLPFGFIADRLDIHPIIFFGSIMVAVSGLVCTFTSNLWILIGARFIQGLFIPALTTCIAAYLSKTLPKKHLNIVMGSYISATVLGGMGGRLLGGWIHPLLHWRYAFISAAILILAAAVTALRVIPRKTNTPFETERINSLNYFTLIRRRDLLRFYFCAAGSFALFSSIYNYLPFRLTGPLFNLPTHLATMLYLSYIVGIFTGPIAGKLSTRFGIKATLIAGSLIIAASLALLLIPLIFAAICGLIGLCAGFFTIHSTAVGALNQRLDSGQGQANALYVLFYYSGGWIGITVSGFVYTLGGWAAVIGFCAILLVFPLMTGIFESRWP